MAPQRGLEPPTFGVTGRRANQLRYWAIWSWWQESNLQPADYKSAALPIELHQHKIPNYISC